MSWSLRDFREAEEIIDENAENMINDEPDDLIDFVVGDEIVDYSDGDTETLLFNTQGSRVEAPTYDQSRLSPGKCVQDNLSKLTDCDERDLYEGSQRDLLSEDVNEHGDLLDFVVSDMIEDEPIRKKR